MQAKILSVAEVEHRLHFEPDASDDPVAVVEHRQRIPAAFFSQLDAIREGQRHSPLFTDGEYQHVLRIPTGVAELWRNTKGFDIYAASAEEIVQFVQGLGDFDRLIVSPQL